MSLPYSGPLAMAVYCISTAVSAVWVMFSFSQIGGAALTFISVVLAWAIFLGLNLARGGRPLRLIVCAFRDVLWLNVLTLTSWLFMFMALQRIEASVESAIYQGWLPLVVILCEALHGRARITPLRALGACLIFTCVMALLAARIFFGGAENLENGNFYEGLALATVAGVTGGIYVYLSGRFHQKTRCSTLDILSIRFFLLLIVTGFMGGGEILLIVQFDLRLIGQLVLLSLFCAMVPVFTLQHAIHELGGGRVSLITPCVPALALLLEFMLTSFSSWVVPVLVLAVCGAVLLANLWFQREPFIKPLHTLPRAI